MSAPALCLCRILGNDLPPLHDAAQSPTNLAYLLAHEPALPRCHKRFVLNRIVDAEREAQLAAMLHDAGHPVDRIAIDPAQYRALPTARARAEYLTNNNGARNHAIALGLAQADVVLPFDGQIMLPAGAWAQLLADVDAQPQCIAYAVPMVRLLAGEDPEQAAARGRHEAHGPSEPQLAIGSRCAARFDPAIAYGRGPKIELLLRLGVAGPWDQWQDPYWAQLRSRPRVAAPGEVGRAGVCVRLPSGNDAATVDIAARQRDRAAGVRALLARADAQLFARPAGG
ncbi:MAG: hypothetical protein U0168_30410 [Nannocystaceae bacterium]